MTESILRLKQVMARTGLSRASVYLFVKNGKFPRQRQLGPRAVGWREADVDAWIKSRPGVAK